MNKLLTFPGLQPIYLGDIDFLQESVRDSFVQLLRGLTGDEKPNCILQKATVGKDGVACVDGEILPYKAYSGTDIGTPSIKVVTVLEGERTFKNGDVHACHERRYGEEYMTVGGMRFPLLTDLLFSRFSVTRGTSNFTNGDVLSAERYVSYSKITSSCIQIEIKVKFTAAADVSTIFDDEVVTVPSAVVSQGNRYYTMVAEIAGSLVSLPAKVSFRADENINYARMTVTIPPTSFSENAEAMLSFMLVINQ